MTFETPAGSPCSRILHRAWMAVPGDAGEIVEAMNLEGVGSGVQPWQRFRPVGLALFVGTEDSDWNEVQEMWTPDPIQEGVG